jgi:hypothetical protein
VPNALNYSGNRVAFQALFAINYHIFAFGAAHSHFFPLSCIKKHIHRKWGIF